MSRIKRKRRAPHTKSLPVSPPLHGDVSARRLSGGCSAPLSPTPLLCSLNHSGPVKEKLAIPRHPETLFGEKEDLQVRHRTEILEDLTGLLFGKPLLFGHRSCARIPAIHTSTHKMMGHLVLKASECRHQSTLRPHVFKHSTLCRRLTNPGFMGYNEYEEFSTLAI